MTKARRLDQGKKGVPSSAERLSPDSVAGAPFKRDKDMKLRLVMGAMTAWPCWAIWAMWKSTNRPFPSSSTMMLLGATSRCHTCSKQGHKHRKST